jgi:hypothetical protein
LSTLLLALALIRPPQVVTPEPDRSYQTVLYETVRQGRSWGDALITTDGPLAALQTPGYIHGSVWMAMSWQIAGNLLLAAVLIGAAFRLTWSRRWWALGFLGILLARQPALAPWLVMVLLGHDLVRRWDREPVEVLPFTGLLGFLALSSLGHLLAGLLAVSLMLATPRPPLAKVLGGASFLGALVGGWLLLGQSPGSLVLWLVRGLPALWSTSPLLRAEAISPFIPWAIATPLALLIGVARHPAAGADRSTFRPAALFLFGSLWLAGKTIVLQPFGLPAVFFGTALLTAFILRHHGLRPFWIGLGAALAVIALIRGNPLLLNDGLGHLNRQIEVNGKLLGDLPALRPRLREEIKSLREIHRLPRIQAAVGAAPVAVLGAPPGRAMLNGLQVALLPAPLDGLLRNPALAARNAAVLEGANAPAFVLQGLQTGGDSTPALINAPAQLALYRHYELQLEENGFMLWRRKTSGLTPAESRLAATGTLHFGEVLRLPATDGAAYWLELDLTPSLPGLASSWLAEIPPPGLMVRDSDGAEVRYALPPATHGLLVDPLVRGEVDFILRQSGRPAPRTTEISLVAPPAGSWAWTGACAYRLHALSGFTLTSQILPANSLDRYRQLNRLPDGVAHAFPFDLFDAAPGQPALFSHPPSLLEFKLKEGDRRVRGLLGIIEGAYRGTDATDGVDFAIEYLGPDGVRQTLFHRSLDPLLTLADRGPQSFDLALPAARGGRLLLRTYNAPGRGAAWDWAFWRNVVIE